MKYLSRFLKSETGATAIEYGMIAALISVVIVVSLGAVGSALGGVYQAWTTAVGTAIN
jgi:pilus assembly protein Flp/PilA